MLNGTPIGWIAVDWGTSNLRAWAMGPEGPVAEASSDQGMARLARAAFEPALLALIEPWLTGPTQVLACGMVGSRQGWVEAPYRRVPCAPLGAALAPVAARDARLQVHVVPGLAQDTPPDVMRGEETQIAGALAVRPGFDGVVCLPGTHTKWALLSAGEVVSFRTFMTGEMFALLSDQSVLRHTVGTGWDSAAFATALEDGMARPEAIAARLFGLRAEGLLSGLEPGTARARLSGLLIGAELAAARPYWLGQQVLVIGEDRLADAYAAALTGQGVPVETLPAQATTLAGLATARAHVKETAA